MAAARNAGCGTAMDSDVPPKDYRQPAT